MTTTRVFNGILAAFAVLLVSKAFAADKGLLHVSSPLNVQEQRLGVGDYTVYWQGAGPNVELKIMQGRRILATVPATVTTMNDTSIDDTCVITINRDGSQSLSQILFAGRKLMFTLEQQANNMNISRMN